MYFALKSLKGLPETLQVMTGSPKQIFVLASGLTGIFATGYGVTQIPNIIINNEQEKTKQIGLQEQTKQMQEQTKQIGLQETTKQKQLDYDILKMKKKWFGF